MKITISKNTFHIKKRITIAIFFLFLIVNTSSLANSQISFSESSSMNVYTNIPTSTDSQDLDLLRVEHYLYVNATAEVDTFHIKFSFPPDYEYQVPLLLEIHNDSTLSEILHFQIENDTYDPNKIINFTIRSMESDESVLLHFSCWVLVKNHDFGDLPSYVKIPKKYQLPNEIKIWIESSTQVQTHSLLIRHKARQLRGLSDNLIRFAQRIAPFIRYHRFGLFVLQLRLGLLISQDARTTLLINGENVGRSHLACAFFRIYDIPARVILVNNDQGFWTQMHYMVEYYCPGYGWVLLETTFGKSPYATKHQVVNRVCYPQDEEDTKEDYIFPFMKGEERWLWIDTESVFPYYVDCNRGSKSQMFSEAVVSSDQLTANFAFLLTERVFRKYQTFLGVELTDENHQHFQNALKYQEDAINALKKNNIEEYISFLNKAYEEYKEIHP